MWPAPLGILLAAAGAVGKPAPRCAAVPDPDAPLAEVTLAELPALLGGYAGCPVLLEVYASWCGTCVQVEPELSALLARHRPAGLAAVGLSVDTNTDALLRWRQQHGRDYAPVLLQGWTLPSLREHFAGMGLEFQEAIPFFVLLAPDGTAVRGYSEPPSLAALEADVQALLAD